MAATAPALLKEKTPSCGCRYIYDGTFTRTLVSGQGITAALLKSHEISVFSQDEICQIPLGRM